jgi:hypothetical protein
MGIKYSYYTFARACFAFTFSASITKSRANRELSPPPSSVSLSLLLLYFTTILQVILGDLKGYLKFLRDCIETLDEEVSTMVISHLVKILKLEATVNMVILVPSNSDCEEKWLEQFSL